MKQWPQILLLPYVPCQKNSLKIIIMNLQILENSELQDHFLNFNSSDLVLK